MCDSEYRARRGVTLKAQLALACVALATFVGGSAAISQSDGIEIAVDEILPISASIQTDQDRALALLDADLSEHHISVDALRSVGSDGVADYWIALEGTSKVCLLGYIPGDKWVAASTCSTVADFYRVGIGLGIGNSESRDVQAYLLPGDILPEQLNLPAGVSLVNTVETGGATLVSFDPTATAPSEYQVQRKNGVTFQFTPMDSRER